MTGTTETPTITDAERQRRTAFLDYARASVGLEGFTISPAMEALIQRHVNGEIDMAELVKWPAR